MNTPPKIFTFLISIIHKEVININKTKSLYKLKTRTGFLRKVEIEL